jgi:hypothetical protein
MSKSGGVSAPNLQTPNIMPFVDNGVQSQEGNLFANSGMFGSTSRVLGQAGQQQAGLAEQASLANQTQFANAQMQQQADAINNANTNSLIGGLGGLAGLFPGI